MDIFVIELAGDPRPHRFEAARWAHTPDYVLTAFDDKGGILKNWGQDEWYRVVEQNEIGHFVNVYVNPFVPKPARP